MARRTIQIPPFKLPDGAGTTARVRVTLVGATGRPVPGIMDEEGIIDPVTVAVGADGAELRLTPQSEIPTETRWKVEIMGRGTTATYVVQLPAGTSPLEFAEFLQLGLPVDPADTWADRLLPGTDGAAVGSGLVLSTDGPTWSAAAPGSGDMQTLIYDPRGILADCFDLSNLTGNIDGGVFT